MNLKDIIVTPLARIETPGGDVLHGIKQSDVGYTNFGEAYFSWVATGFIKGWKLHKRMTLNLMVPVGQVRFVFHKMNADEQEEFRVEEIGTNRYARITVPPGIWFGFEGVSEAPSLVLNIASIPHDPTEVERLALADINYVWS